MGVYLPNIEMPKEGRLTLQISADGAVYVVNSCSITAETYTTDAVPVPPHGDLVDCDALYEKIADSFGGIDCAKLLDEDFAPTVIPEEGET